MDAKITAKVETITPEIAKTMLGENVNNRRISRDNVNLFAREIRNGEWRFNGEAIKFGKDGRLLDGQHRLLAVIAADKPLTTLVIRGLEDETQQTMDSGKNPHLGRRAHLARRKELHAARLTGPRRVSGRPAGHGGRRSERFETHAR